VFVSESREHSCHWLPRSRKRLANVYRSSVACITFTKLIDSRAPHFPATSQETGWGQRTRDDHQFCLECDVRWINREPVQLTSDARVVGLEVGHQLLGARVIGVQRGVGDVEPAGAPARAASVEMGHHVGRAADTAVVLAHAASEPHPAVARRRHQDHVIRPRRARRVERLPLAVLDAAAAGAICTYDQHAQIY